MRETRPIDILSVLLFAIVVSSVQARDLFDATGDTACATSTAEMFHGSPPQSHDLEAFGGINDVDFIWTYTQPFRSYEFVMTGPAAALADLVVTNSSGTPVLSSLPLAGNSYARAVRWIELPAGGGVLCARVAALAALNTNAQYTMTFRETTLYCPRYNNTGTQTSVLLIQDARFDPIGTCDFEASFRNESGVLVGSLLESLAPGAVRVLALPGIAGLAGTKGSAQIAHTCGTGGIKAKLVALEPSTGFSFDTVCSHREP